MADPLKQIFSRVWPHREWSLESPSLPGQYSNSWQKPLLGFVNQAMIQAGTGAAGLVVTAGQQIPGPVGRNLTLTIATGAGALAVSSNGLDITVTLASGGSHASAVVAAINAQFSSLFASAALLPGSAGGTNVAALSKTNFKATQRAP